MKYRRLIMTIQQQIKQRNSFWHSIVLMEFYMETFFFNILEKTPLMKQKYNLIADLYLFLYQNGKLCFKKSRIST